MMTWAFIPEEGWSHVDSLLTKFAARLARLGTLNDLQWWYDDRCCQHNNDVTDHPVVRIFKMITRAPHRDNFHVVQLLNQSVYQHCDIYVEFSRHMGRLIAEPCPVDITGVFTYLTTRQSKPLTSEQATGRERKHNPRSVRTQGKPREVLVQDLQAAQELWQVCTHQKSIDHCFLCAHSRLRVHSCAWAWTHTQTRTHTHTHTHTHTYTRMRTRAFVDTHTHTHTHTYTHTRVCTSIYIHAHPLPHAHAHTKV